MPTKRRRVKWILHSTIVGYYAESVGLITSWADTIAQT
jgi:hypothetical protein